jgi:riboflavin synthase
VFTGIVVEQGVVEAPAPALVLSSELVSSDVAIGDSVAVDGCCLTVTAIDGRRLRFDAVPETLDRTTLGDRVAGDVINLEPALRVGDRMGGHWVQGHVDGVGRVGSLTPNGNAVEIWFEAPPAVLRYVIEKGSIAVNGVSLTVTGFDDRGFGVSLIPHTLEATNFGRLQPGDRVNLEADLFGKYVERLTTRGVPSEQDER